MKSGRKHKGTKAKIRAEREKERRVVTSVFLTFLSSVIVFSTYFTYNYLNQFPAQTTSPAFSQLKAAIVDQLSLTVPNQTFIETAADILKKAGYTVDYYPGEKVTVEFYRNLPTHGYKIIILRVHSTATEARGIEGPVTFFTSELYSERKYVYEQLTGQLCAVAFSREQAEKGIRYFGISPLFVIHSMRGRFQDTVIIMMGCEGLDNPLMAMAFKEKGAKTYISWNQQVLASHTDIATTRLLHHLLIEKLTLNQALRETFKEIGFDPRHQSLLIYYPLEAGDQTIEDLTGNPKTRP